MTAGLPDAFVVNVAGLLGEPPGSRREVRLTDVVLDLGPDLGGVVPVTVEARVSRTNRGVLVAGRVTTALADVCGRCLAPLDLPVDAAFDEEVLPSVDLASGAPVDRVPEPEAARLSDHHELDLEPLAREAIQLAAPIVPVCRPDCAGLCPTCGVDLNLEPHDHGGPAVDPRLAALRDFRPAG